MSREDRRIIGALAAALVGVCVAFLAACAVLLPGTAARGSQGPTEANPGTLQPAAVPPCEGTVVTVAYDEPTGCDLQPPQRLDVTGATIAQCDDMGGTFDRGTCRGVDY